MNERERLFHSFLMLSRSPAESNSTYVVDSLDAYLEAYLKLKAYKETDLADAYQKGWDDAMLRKSLEEK
jgi:hypothetical protein